MRPCVRVHVCGGHALPAPKPCRPDAAPHVRLLACPSLQTSANSASLFDVQSYLKPVAEGRGQVSVAMIVRLERRACKVLDGIAAELAAIAGRRGAGAPAAERDESFADRVRCNGRGGGAQQNTVAAGVGREFCWHGCTTGACTAPYRIPYYGRYSAPDDPAPCPFTYDS